LAHCAKKPYLSAVAQPSWREFERLIGDMFRKRGFSVKEKDWAGPDGGMDVELRRDG